MTNKLDYLMARAEQLITRIESVLPQPLSAPDWAAAIAWRYTASAAAAMARWSRCATWVAWRCTT